MCSWLLGHGKSAFNREVEVKIHSWNRCCWDMVEWP